MHHRYKDAEFWISSHGDVIYYRPFGMFSHDTSLRAIDAFSKAILKLNTQQFALLVDTSGLTGFSAESNQAWLDAFDDWFNRGHRAMVRIDNQSSIIYRVFIRGFDSRYASRMPASLHATAEAALQRLRELGFSADSLNSDTIQQSEPNSISVQEPDKP